MASYDRTINEYDTVGGMRIGRGDRSTRRKPATMALCPPEIPHDVTWDRTRVAVVGNRQLTTTSFPIHCSLVVLSFS
jgi:hypothetical protein